MPSMCGCFSRFPACTVSLFICLYACEFPVGTEYNITVYVSFGSSMKVKVKVKSLSRVRLFVTTWTVAYQTPPSMGFSRQECWSGLPFPSPRDLPDPGIEPRCPTLQADALPSEPPGKPGFSILPSKV